MGGIGITPMQSICNQLLHEETQGRPIKKIIFIWSIRDLWMITSILDHNDKYFKNHLPSALPMSF